MEGHITPAECYCSLTVRDPTPVERKFGAFHLILQPKLVEDTAGTKIDVDATFSITKVIKITNEADAVGERRIHEKKLDITLPYEDLQKLKLIINSCIENVEKQIRSIKL